MQCGLEVTGLGDVGREDFARLNKIQGADSGLLLPLALCPGASRAKIDLERDREAALEGHCHEDRNGLGLVLGPSKAGRRTEWPGSVAALVRRARMSAASASLGILGGD